MNEPNKLDFFYYRGRIALYHFLKCLDLEDGSFVAIQPYTCVAVPEAIMVAGFKPLYVDIELKTLSMSPEKLQEACEKNIVGAIVVQHSFGIKSNIEAIAEIAKKHNIPLIADCCHISPFMDGGDEYVKDCDAAFYSFEWGKPIAKGLGGMLRVFNNQLESQLVKSYRSCVSPSLIRLFKIEIQYYLFTLLYRPKTYWVMKRLFHAFSKLGFAEGNFHENLEKITAQDYEVKISPLVSKRVLKKETSCKINYKKMLNNTNLYLHGLDPAYLEELSHSKISSSQFPLVRFPIQVKYKKKFLAHAKKINIEVAGWYTSPVHPLDKHDLSQVAYQPGSCQVAEYACDHVVSLPTNTMYKEKDIRKIIDHLNKQEKCFA